MKRLLLGSSLSVNRGIFGVFFNPNVCYCTVMAGRKRKASPLASAAEQDVNSDDRAAFELKVSPARHKTHISVRTVNVETEQSRYFAKTGPGSRLGGDDFNQPCISLAKAFLGKVLVRRRADGSELRGRIVETEAYLGGEDKASHSAGGKRTERNTAMFMKPGTIYVYPIYGIYLCMNVSSQGDGAAVLLRSLEPLRGHEVMRRLRAARRREGARQLKDKELCNGPSKLCQALDIPRCFDRRDLASDPEVWMEDDPSASPPEDRDVVTAPRIGVESHGEWAKKPLRFYLRGHPCVSVTNKEAERTTVSGNAMNSAGARANAGRHKVTRTSPERP